jgi:ketosteroid isomerase-like protein
MYLPEPLSDYFRAANAGNADDASACFAADAVVHDEGEEHRGQAAIRDWLEEATRKYSPRAQVLMVTDDGKTTIVTAKVSGDFPGSPVELDYGFQIRGGLISRLEIH